MKLELRWSGALCFLVIAVAAVLRLGWLEGLWVAGAITVSVLMHELGHAAVAQYYGIPVKAIGMSLKGGYTIRSRSERKYVEALTTAAGPAVNVILCAVFFLLSDRTSIWIGTANFILAATNVLPVGASDGWRLIKLLSR